MWTEKEIEKRQLIESGGHSVILRFAWRLCLMGFVHPNLKRRGKARVFFTTIQGTNKVIIFSINTE